MLRTDMRVTCKHCGGPHPAFECRKKSSGGSSAAEHRPSKSSVVGSTPTRRSRAPVQDAKAVKVNMVATIATEPAQEAQILRPGPNAGSSNGRTAEFDSANAGSTPAPASKFDKKAWMREYMKIYMARYREDVKNGKRTPKKKVKAS